MTGSPPHHRTDRPRSTVAAPSTTRRGGWRGSLRRLRSLVEAVVAVAGLCLAIAVSAAPSASAGELVLAQAPASFQALIDKLQGWVVGLLVGLATLYLTVGGVRMLAADGDPGEVERAKKSIRNALVGYAIAALSPLIVSVLRSLVG